MNGARVFVSALFIICAQLLLASCGADDSPVYSARQIADVIISSQTGLPPLNVMTSQDENFARHLENFYMLDTKALSDGAIYYAGGTEASEIAVFELAENAAPEQVEDALAEYIDGRAKSFAGYFPRQAALIENGVVSVNGDFVALLICENTVDAESVFLACFSDDPPELPDASALAAMAPAPASEIVLDAPEPEEELLADEYDPAAILAAWKSGGQSALTARNAAILESCAEAIDELVAEDMQDHEKELAVHDWIAERAVYDDGLLSNAPVAEPHPDSDNPYGLLVRRKATCAGYAHTFKLFMDMLATECLTVEGTSQLGGEEHMWNMVRLDDGEWYCVDVTWDDTDNVPEEGEAPVYHKYFNVTSEFMRYNDHQWDETSVPEAVSERFQ